MSRYQDIYDEASGDGPKMLKELRVKKHQERIDELTLEIAAVEGAMDREDFRVRWEKLKKIQDRLNNERKNLLKLI
jgi:hypothetical protein